MIELWDIRYVRLGTRDIDAATRYATTMLGLERSRGEAGAHYFRSDARDHTLVYFDGDPGDHAVGFDLRDGDALDAAASLLSDRGHAVDAGSPDACEQRRVRAFVHFRDLSGNRIELVVPPVDGADTGPPRVGAGIAGFSHVGLCTTDAVRDEAFWTGLMGARVSDRIGSAPLLRIDEVHHKIALFPAQRCGVQHVNHQVHSIDDVMRAWYRLQRAGVRIVFGPGRHPTSGACFLYFEGPDGMVYEYSTGVRCFTPDEDKAHQPRQFPMARESFCQWGAVPDIAEFRN